MEKRGVFAVFALSLITLGIYSLYWTYKTREGLIARVEDKKSIPAFILLLAPVIVILALIPLFLLNLALNADTSSMGQNIFSSIIMIIGMTAAFGSIVIGFWWYYRFFEVLSKVTKGSGLGLLYALWIMAYIIGLPIWILVAQGDINKLLENDPGHHAGGQPSGPADPPYPTVTPAAPLS
ncbi:MAG: DUF4234 domain-containing protein [Candidatus Saccharimonadales bacterium]